MEAYYLVSNHVEFRVASIREECCGRIGIHLDRCYIALHKDDAKELADGIYKVLNEGKKDERH